MSSEDTSRHVPLIDLSQSDDEAATELFKALSTVGFACLTNTGLWNLAEDYSKQAKEFFLLPQSEKDKFPGPQIGDFSGRSSLASEYANIERPAGDYREGFLVRYKHKSNFDRHPPQIDNKQCWDLWDKCVEVGNRVNYLIGMGLKLEDPHFIEKTHSFYDGERSPAVLKVNWYDKVDKSKLEVGQIRCGEHTDYGSITLLYTDSPGLQVMNRETGEYVDAGYKEGGIFVNIGDLLQMWSADVLIANKHRVLIPEDQYLNESRVSVVFFCQPDNNVVIEALDGSGKYPTVTSGSWLEQRFKAKFDAKAAKEKGASSEQKLNGL